MSKPRKYQITPNSIDPSEEAAVRSVMDKFRQRAEQPEPVAPEVTPEPSRDVVRFPADRVDVHREIVQTPTSDFSGRPQSKDGDAHQVISETPTVSEWGRPPDFNVDAHNMEMETSTKNEYRRPPVENTDAHKAKIETPTDADSGRPPALKVGVMAPKDGFEASTTPVESGAKASTAQNVGAHKSGRRGDRHNNPSTERLALRPNGEILKKVKHFCVERNYSLTEFFELASLKFIDLGAHQDENGGAMAPLNNGRSMMGLKTEKTIINLYLAWTAAFNEKSDATGKKWTGKWRPADDLVGVQYNEIDARLIELGILQTQSNKGIGNGKIQSFSYYIGEIDVSIRDAGHMSPAALDAILQHHRTSMFRWLGREVDLSFLGNE